MNYFEWAEALAPAAIDAVSALLHHGHASECHLAANPDLLRKFKGTVVAYPDDADPVAVLSALRGDASAPAPAKRKAKK